MDTVTMLYYILFLTLLLAGTLAVAIGMTINAQNRATRDAGASLLDYILEQMSKRERE